MKEVFHIFTLGNGIRCIHRQTSSGVARMAVIVNAGTRDELHREHGIAHFTEHGFFKGTERRKAYQVNCRLENLGGELNAYTTKEDTTIHATVLRQDFEKAAELLSDVVFHSTFPEKEIEKEHDVILDEINTYRDSPSDLIFDSFEEKLFDGSELGHAILGTKQSLKGIDSQAIRAFVRRTYTTDQIVVASIGNISPKRARMIAERYFGEQEASTRSFSRQSPEPYRRFDERVDRRTHQTHCIIGGRAYDINDDRRVALSLATNILGGPCANSRLNVTVREKWGLTYNIEAMYSAFCDTGCSMIYFSSEHDNASRCLELIEEQTEKLKREALTPRQLSMAKKQFIAQMAISTESQENYILGLGKSLLVHDGGVDTLDEVFRKINAVTADQILEVSNRAFTDTSILMYR